MCFLDSLSAFHCFGWPDTSKLRALQGLLSGHVCGTNKMCHSELKLENSALKPVKLILHRECVFCK